MGQAISRLKHFCNTCCNIKKIAIKIVGVADELANAGGEQVMSVVRLTMAQALVRYLCNQFTVVDGDRVPLFPGVFAIFGPGNVTCLSEALEAVQDKLPSLVIV